jgi:hypothetical protein
VVVVIGFGFGFGFLSASASGSSAAETFASLDVGEIRDASRAAATAARWTFGGRIGAVYTSRVAAFATA